MASSRTLLIRAPKRVHRVLSYGPVAEIHFWGNPIPQTVSIRRSEFRRYTRDARVSAVIPFHIEDPTTKRREYDLRPKRKPGSEAIGAA